MGATVVRVSIPRLDELTRGLSLMNFEFKAAFDNYLASLGPASPVKSLAEFVARGEFHESMRRGLEGDLERHRRTRLAGVPANVRAPRNAAPGGDDGDGRQRARRDPVSASEAPGRADRRGSGGAQRRAVEQHRLSGVDVPRRILAARPRPRRSACRSASSCSDPSGASPCCSSWRLRSSRPRRFASRRRARRR